MPLLTVNTGRRIQVIRGIVFACDILPSAFRSLKEGETFVFVVYRTALVCSSDVSCSSVVAQNWDILGSVWARLLPGSGGLWSNNRRRHWRIPVLA